MRRLTSLLILTLLVAAPAVAQGIPTPQPPAAAPTRFSAQAAPPAAAPTRKHHAHRRLRHREIRRRGR